LGIGISRDEKPKFAFPLYTVETGTKSVSVSTVYKGNANFVFRPWELELLRMLDGAEIRN
jgi:hypothetical protein